jgi:hypothetical protein
VAWSPATQGFAAVGYTAAVTLTAKAPYTFEGVGTDAFTHAYAPGAVTNAAGSGAVTIVFPQPVRYTGIDLPFSGEWTVPPELLATVTALIGNGDPEYLDSPNDEHSSGAPTQKVKEAVIALLRQAPLNRYYTEDDIDTITDGWATTGQDGDPSPEKDNNRALITGLHPTGYTDSVLDLIESATAQTYLYLDLAWRPEERVDFTKGDFGRLGGLRPNNLIIVIDGGGRALDLTGSVGGYAVTVGTGLVLTLRNITVKGLKAGEPGDENDNGAALVMVSNGGQFTLEDGAAIRDNTSTGWTGGGVYIEGEGSPGRLRISSIIS